MIKFYQKKIERILNRQKEKGEEDSKLHGSYGHDEEELELEYKDVLAIIISALIVFGPILLFLFGILYLLTITW